MCIHVYIYMYIYIYIHNMGIYIICVYTDQAQSNATVFGDQHQHQVRGGPKFCGIISLHVHVRKHRHRHIHLTCIYIYSYIYIYVYASLGGWRLPEIHGIPCGTPICCVVSVRVFRTLRACKILILPASHGVFALTWDGAKITVWSVS